MEKSMISNRKKIAAVVASVGAIALAAGIALLPKELKAEPEEFSGCNLCTPWRIPESEEKQGNKNEGAANPQAGTYGYKLQTKEQAEATLTAGALSEYSVGSQSVDSYSEQYDRQLAGPEQATVASQKEVDDAIREAIQAPEDSEVIHDGDNVTVVTPVVTPEPVREVVTPEAPVVVWQPTPEPTPEYTPEPTPAPEVTPEPEPEPEMEQGRTYEEWVEFCNISGQDYDQAINACVVRPVVEEDGELVF